MPRGQPSFIQDSRQNVANVAGQHQLHVNETYPSLLPSYWQSITAESGGTQLESMECARLIIGSASGNHMMFIGGLDQASPFSGRGTPLYPGLEGEREIFIENSNRVRICASFSGELIYYMGYINGQPTSISAATQGTQPNNQPPFLVRTDPLDGEHNVGFQGSGNAFISIFNENVASGTADISSYSIRISGNFDAVISGTVDYFQPEDASDRTRIRFTAASGELLGSSWYNVYVGQRIADDFGSNITSTLTWSFITAGVDDSPMFLQSFSPVSGTSLVPFSQEITASFSKRISGSVNATGFTNNIFVWNDNIPLVGVSGVTLLSNISGTTLTFTPISLLNPSTIYRYAITGVTDLFGNYAIPQSGMAFSTIAADTAGPIISSYSPVSGASGTVPTLTNLVVTFDERLSGILGGVISGQVIQLVNSGDQATKLSGVISLNASGNILTFNPVAELISGTAYIWAVSGVYDVNGNILSQTVPPRSGITFRTWVEADVTPPVFAITPTSGSVGVSHGINVVATFNETLSGTHPANPYASIISLDLSGTGSIAGLVTTNSSGTVVTFNPTNDLSGDRTYYVSVSGAQDLALNRISPVSGHSFRVLDNIAPTVSSISPVSGSIDNVLTTNVVVTLSEAISGTANGAITADVVRLYKSGVPGVSFAGTRALDSTRTVITFDPSANLDPDEHYQVGISGITDVSGNVMVAGRVSGHSFVTAGGPLITATTPVSGQSGVALNSNIVITFNKAISGTANGTVAAGVTKLWLSHGSIFSGLAGTNTLNADRTQLTFNPTADLLDTKSYLFAISGVFDLSGFQITQTNPPRSGRSFSTIVVDTTPPTVTTTVPASGALNVLTNTTYVVNFSETVSGNSGSTMPTNTVNLWISGTVLPGGYIAGSVVKTADTQFTFTPSAQLSGNLWYRASVTGVYDIATPGNVMTPRSGLSFRTVDNIAPLVTTITPSSGQINVIVTDNITVQFNESISGTSGGTIVAQVVSLIESGNPGVLLGGATTLSTDRTTITFNPTNNYNYDIWHEVRVSGVRDLSDNFVVPVSGHPFKSQGQPLTTVYENAGTNTRSFDGLAINALGIFREGTSSQLNGKVIKRASWKMARVGTRTATVECVIIKDIDPGGGDNGLAVVIGTAAFNSISTTATRVVFQNLNNTYALSTDDWIGIRYSGATASADLTMYYSADNVDGTLTQYASYDTDWSDFPDRDVDAKLEE